MRLSVDKATDPASVADNAPAFDRDDCAPDDSIPTHPVHAKLDYVQLEIRTDTLYKLINNKALVIEDLRGLDRQAKSWIRRRLLDTLLL